MSNVANIEKFQSPSSASSAVKDLFEAGTRALISRNLKRVNLLRSRLMFRHKANGLALPITNLQAGSGTKARLLYRGNFDFAGEVFKRKESNIFTETGMSVIWQEKLHSFSWLIDMKIAGSELSRAQSRRLITEWIQSNGNSSNALFFGVGNSSHIMARRIISWAHNAPFFLSNCPESFNERFFSSINLQVKSLFSRALIEKNKLMRLQAVIALTTATLGFSGLEGLRTKALERLAKELDGQILADGGHISRNPQVLRDLLGDLIPIRLVLESARIEIPAALNAALERMIPALRFFSYPDGGLAVFNGVNDIRAGINRRILETDTICGTPLSHARHSGYVRLQQGNSTIMIDAGKPTTPGINANATAGVMAFEFCDDSSRIITNCGSIQFAGNAWHDASRSTQAHSSLCLDDKPAGGILDGVLSKLLFGGPIVLSAPNVNATTQMVKEGAVFTGSHDGYLNSLGVTHERQIFLNATGSHLRGQDSFIVIDWQTNNVPFAIRFHLHPSVRATISQDGSTAMLLLANKTGWQFKARGAQLNLEDSVFLPENGRVRKTSQLVLRGSVLSPADVLWSFKRIEKTKSNKQKVSEPTLL